MVKAVKVLPKVGVSRCLLGDNVRYDGQEKRNAVVADELAGVFEWVGVCPEVGIGMGVPRPPIELVMYGDGGIQVHGVADRAINPQAELEGYARRIHRQFPELCGFVLKARSPSCGLAVDVHGWERELLEGKAPGVFAGEWMRLNPDMPVIDEESLQDADLRQAFIRRVERYAAGKP